MQDVTPEAILGAGIVMVGAFVDIDPARAQQLQEGATVLAPMIVGSGTALRINRLRKLADKIDWDAPGADRRAHFLERSQSNLLLAGVALTLVVAIAALAVAIVA